MENLANANGMPSSCKCNISAVTAKYEAEHIISQAQSKVAMELAYGDFNLSPHNSQGVNEAAMGVLTSVRHYLNGTGSGIAIPGMNTAYLYSRVVVNQSVPNHPQYAIDSEIMEEAHV